MIKKIFSLFFLCSYFIANAQYTRVINSNRPGFSESPYSVGSGIYQLENGLFYGSSTIVPTFTIPKSFGYQLIFRTSFFSDKLEFNTNIKIQKDQVAFKNIFTSHYFVSGLSEFSFGAKYLFYEPTLTDRSKEIRSWKRKFAFDWKSVVPSIAGYVGFNTNFVNSVHKLESITPKIGVLLQNNLTSDLNLITNIFYDNIGSQYSEFSHIITATYNLNDEWSTFLEHKATYNKFQTTNDIGTGIAFLANRHLQIDASARVNFDKKTTGVYSGIGFSFRLDRHIDPFILVDEKGNEIIDEKPVYNLEKKNFIGKVFDFFKFKKKEKKVESKYDRKRPVRKRIESVLKKEKKKKTRGGFFDFLKKKDTTEDDSKKTEETEENDETKKNN